LRLQQQLQRSKEGTGGHLDELEPDMIATPFINYSAFKKLPFENKPADPTFAAIVFSTESVFSAVGGVLFGIDSISPLGYVGCGVMFAGIVISQLQISGKRKKDVLE